VMTGEMGTSGDSPAGHLHATEKLSGAASRHLVVPGWACGVSGAASRQLVAPHRWGTRLGVWCEWSGLSTAGVGYSAGRVV
jgi:hypothetical protein